MKIVIDIYEEVLEGIVFKNKNKISLKPSELAILHGTPLEAQQTDKCKGCYYDDGEVHAECVICDKEAHPMGMRDATEEERKSVKDYVESISKPTGFNFYKAQPTSDDDIIKALKAVRTIHNGNYAPQIDEAIRRLKAQPSEDCRNCKKWNKCPCGKEGHENGTSIGYSIGECKDYEPSEDCISRESIVNKIHALQNELTSNEDSKWNRNKLAFKYMAYVNGIILNEPSVTPRTNLAETSQDCISREEVLEHICEDKECYKEGCKGRTLKRCPDLQWVFDLPPVKPRRPKGKWIVHPKGIYSHLVCNKCLSCAPYDCETNYCPNCGAEMSGGEDDEDA